MTAIPDTRAAAALIILLGCLLALAASLVPFYDVANTYRIDALALSVLLTSFVVYGMFIEDLRRPWLLAAGIALLGVSAAVVIAERFPVYEGYARVYWVPLVAVAVVLALAYAFGRRDPYGEAA